MKRHIAASTYLLAAFAAASAHGADLAPVPASTGAPPVFSWNGLHAGVNIGYGFANNATGFGSALESNAALMGAWSMGQGANGVIGGGQVGYDYQVSPLFVVGAEADIQASDVNGQRSTLTGGVAYPQDRISINNATFIDWFGTVRGRLGVTLPGWSTVLLYGTGGFAYSSVSNSVNILDNWGIGAFGGAGAYGETRTGWTAGGGVEWSPAAFPAWSLKAEYLFTDLGSVRQNVASSFSVADAVGYSFTAVQNTPTAFHSVRVGLNWRFNPFAPSSITR